MMCHKWALVAAALVTPAAVLAQTTTYKGYDANTSTGDAATSNPNSNAANASFNSALSGTSTESFESFATGTSAPLALNFTGSAGNLPATLTGSGAVQSATRASPTSSGQFATAGSKYYEVEAGGFAITFGSPVAAFGFYATDIETNIQLIFSHVTGPTETFTFQPLFPAVDYENLNVPSGSVNFLGFINTTNLFTGVTFARPASGVGETLAFDQMTIGDARQVVNPPGNTVPEPATWAMMLLGFGGIGDAMRRQRRGGVRAHFA